LHGISRSTTADFINEQLFVTPTNSTNSAIASPSIKPCCDDMDHSKALDFLLIVDNMRPSRSGNIREPIRLVPMCQPTGEAMRMQIVWLAEALGYCSATTKKDFTEIAEATSQIVYYHNGFKKEPKEAMVHSWMEQLDEAHHSDCVASFSNLLKNKQIGPKQGKYTE
jgi:hypothetical protein